MIRNKYIDLHIHSNYSDGNFTPKQLINIAENNNVKILAITDHDSISGLREFKDNISYGLFGVNGIELSSYIVDNNENTRIHILGYCFDEKNYLFQKLVNEMNDKRRNIHLRLLKELREKIKKIPEEEIKKININRYCWFDREVIECLEKSKYPKEIIDELKLHYKINKFSYGDDYNLNVRRVIDGIHSAGGYVVLAHPMSYDFSYDKDRVSRIINKLIDMGIDGIEIFHTECSLNDTIWLREIVNKNNLLYSVGSDFHRFIDSDGRQIGLGIDNNLCISETSLTNEILKTKKYFKKVN